MASWNFCKIDLMKMKQQIRLIFLFALLAVLLSIKGDMYIWGPCYISFGVIVIATTPFVDKQNKCDGFLCMLPASVGSRIRGRFLFGLLLTGFSVCMSVVDLLVVKLIVKKSFALPEAMLQLVLIHTIALIFIVVQFVILFLAGSVKSNQVMAVIRMVPGFLFFFGGTFIFSNFSEGNGIDILEWVIKNQLVVAIIFAAIAAVLYLLGIMICTLKEEKRDFSN